MERKLLVTFGDQTVVIWCTLYASYEIFAIQCTLCASYESLAIWFGAIAHPSCDIFYHTLCIAHTQAMIHWQIDKSFATEIVPQSVLLGSSSSTSVTVPITIIINIVNMTRESGGQHQSQAVAEWSRGQCHFKGSTTTWFILEIFLEFRLRYNDTDGFWLAHWVLRILHSIPSSPLQIQKG